MFTNRFIPEKPSEYEFEKKSAIADPI